MPYQEPLIRYATGEIASIGDRVNNDGWPSIVKAVIATEEEMSSWGFGEPGLMLDCEFAGLVFEPRSSAAWNAILCEGRGL